MEDIVMVKFFVVLSLLALGFITGYIVGNADKR